MKPEDKLPEIKLDPANLYREEIFTDRKVGTLRRMLPVKADGSSDDKRKVLYIGEAQLLTPVGALPLAFEIEATSLVEALEKFPAAAKAGVERAVKELQQMRREAASSLIIPDAGAAAAAGLTAPGGIPPGGKIKLP
ncbi:MAG: hypothetical protein JSW09_07325 [Pseudomonadota bacterium]|nr:MAG: hypothetical protein JSW09_07325 [Pseudomonadota bacterium]